MIPHIGTTQETMENINLSNMIIPTGKVRVTSATALDRLVDTRYTNHETIADSKITHAIIMTDHAHQVVFASEIDIHNRAMNIHGLIHPKAICHVLCVKVHNTHSQIEYVLHRLSRSRRT